MPYTKPENRKWIKTHIEIIMRDIKTPGDLTYAITLLMHLQTLKEPLCYAKMSAIRASAQDSADEYYRVVMSKYEDLKRGENGSVSSLDDVSPTTPAFSQCIECEKQILYTAYDWRCSCGCWNYRRRESGPNDV